MVAIAAQLPGDRARPTRKLVSQMFQGLSLCLMALEAQPWALETIVFLAWASFSRKATGL
jgi:hypothetical protein